MAASSRMSHHLLEVRSALARAELEVRLRSVALALRRFNPSQPRLPAGSADGGQWTDDGGGAAAPGFGGAGRFRPDVRPVGGFAQEHLGMTVQDFMSTHCLGSIRSVVPGQFLGSTISEVIRPARKGDPAARRCFKVLGRDKFRK
jgi:hypothetical protein